MVVLGVAGSAEEDAVLGVGGSSVGPVPDVVDVAVSCWGVAAGCLAVLVSGGDGSALGAGPDAGFAADVEYFCVWAEHDSDDRAVAGDLADGVDGEDVPVFCLV